MPIQNNPVNINHLRNTNFKFDCIQIPTFSYTVQTCTLPGLTASTTTQGTPFNPLPVQGTSLTYEPLGVEFLVLEDLSNWMEIYNWMLGITGPQNFDQHTPELETLFADITIILTTNKKLPAIEFTYKNAYPTSLSGFPLSSKEATVDEISGNVVFTYDYYSVKFL